MTDTVPRGDLRPPGIDADEKTTLLTCLDYLREAVAAKAAGLSEEAVRTPGVASGTSLLWLVKHMAAVERNWFEWAWAGRDIPLTDDETAPGADETTAGLLAGYRAAAARSNEIVAACDDLSRRGARNLREAAEPPTLRWVLVHMIEETARHAGHADILRERLDGAVGR